MVEEIRPLPFPQIQTFHFQYDNTHVDSSLNNPGDIVLRYRNCEEVHIQSLLSDQKKILTDSEYHE